MNNTNLVYPIFIAFEEAMLDFYRKSYNGAPKVTGPAIKARVEDLKVMLLEAEEQGIGALITRVGQFQDQSETVSENIPDALFADEAMTDWVNTFLDVEWKVLDALVAEVKKLRPLYC